MARRTTRNWPDYVSLALLLAMVLWFGREMIWDGYIPFFRDLGAYFYPMRFSLAQSFKLGESPLWDRHMAMGLPLLANFQSGALYPPHLLFFLLSFFKAIAAIYLLHFLIAATGSYVLCRSWDFPPYLAIIGSILFTFSGLIVSLTNLLNHFQTAVWLPWIVFVGERCFRKLTWGNFLAFSCISCLDFLAGSPEFYVMNIGIVLVDGARLKATEHEITYRRIIFVIVAVAIVTAGLTMAQLLPSIELFSQSRRQQSISYGEATMWSLSPDRLLNLFFLDKEIDTGIASGAQFFFSSESGFFLSLYMGAITLLGISLWLFSSSVREKCVASGLVLLSLALAFGNHTVVYPYLFQHIPHFGVVRFPEKFFFSTYLFLLFIALRGLHGFIAGESNLRRCFVVLSSAGALLLLFYVCLRFNTQPLSLFVAWITHTPPLTTPTIKRSSSVLVGLERQIALIVCIIALFLLHKTRKLRESLFIPLLIAIIFIDLNSAHRPYQFLLDPGFVYKSPRIIKQPEPELARLFYYPPGSSVHPSYVSILGQPSFAEMNAFVFSNLLPNTGIFYGFDYFQEIDAFGRRPYTLFVEFANELPPVRRFQLLRSLNVKYVNSFRPLEGEGITLLRYFPEYPSWLYQLKSFTPRAYIVHKVVVEKDWSKIVERMSSAKFEPLAEVILEEPLATLQPPRSSRRETGTAMIMDYKNQRVSIRALLDSPGLLILADSFYPGWRAYVDGKETPILRANLFFRAVVLSPGDHVVEFLYDPVSFKIGLAVSLVTLSGLICVSVWKQVTVQREWESFT